MKVLLFFCGLAIAAGSEQWENFKSTHGKAYTNVKEELYRKAIFEDNQKYVEEHNERFRQELVTFDLKMNQFGDMTSEEFVAQMSRLNKAERTAGAVLAHLPNEQRADTVDWRDKGAVTPVKDQGILGASWAYSAVGPLEGIWFLKTGDLYDMSEQQLADCVTFNYSRNSGVVDVAYEYIKNNGGIDSEETYPQVEQGGECLFNPDGVVATVTGSIDIPEGDEITQAKAVHDAGPISVLLDASHLSFQLYSSGIYYEPTCNPMFLDHAVVIVGYGTEGETDYWIVKNSWGSNWGESGYIRTARNKDNHCGIATQSCYPTV